MSHYYIHDPNLDHDIKKIELEIDGISLVFYTDKGVFSKDKIDFGTLLLMKSAQLIHPESKVIDVGCGYGPVGIFIAKKHPKASVILVDINDRALELAQKNQAINDVKNVDVRHSNGLESVSEKADLILTNPPIRAGKEVVFKIYQEAYHRLNANGRLMVVIQKKQGAPSSFEKIKTLFGNAVVLTKDKGYWILLAEKEA